LKQINQEIRKKKKNKKQIRKRRTKSFRQYKIYVLLCLAPKVWGKNNNSSGDSSEFSSHPGDDLHDDPGAGLLQHRHGQVVRDALQAVPVDRQQTIPASVKNR
jgi:hypothetical protein